MLIDQCIKERRSVRKYTDKEIPSSVLKELVDLSRFSPSWKNTQAVRYHMIKNPEIKKRNCRPLCTEF